MNRQDIIHCYDTDCPYNFNKYAWECRANDNEIKFIIDNYKHFCPIWHIKHYEERQTIFKHLKEYRESEKIIQKLAGDSNDEK